MYRIKEVSRRTGIHAHTLRYWEKEFGGLLLPTRSQGKHRFYSDEDMERVQLIKKLLKDEGYSIQGARRALEARAESHANGNGHTNGNGHANGNGHVNGNGHSNGNGNGHHSADELPEGLVDRIAAAVARKVADMIANDPEPKTSEAIPSVAYAAAEAVTGK